MGKYKPLYAIVAVIIFTSIILIIESYHRRHKAIVNNDSTSVMINTLQIEKDSTDLKSKAYESKVDGTLVKLRTMTKDTVTNKDIKEATEWAQKYNYSSP